MEDCFPTLTPLDPGIKIVINPDENPRYDDEFTKQAYQSGVGSVQYLASQTRPDIAEAAGLLARFNTKLNWQCWQALKHLLKYLSGTKNLGIPYRKNGALEPVTYADANWAGRDPGCHLTSGYIIMMAGAPVSWRSARQTSVSQSTTKAKYISTSDTACELVWLNNLLTNTGLLEKENENKNIRTVELCSKSAKEVNVDNKGVIDLAKSESIGKRSKHIEVRFHILRDLVEKNEIKLTYVDSNSNLADGLTKPLPKTPFKIFREGIGIMEV